jgi:hypothetical protein
MLFEQEQRVALQQRPEQSDQPQRSIRELVLLLPSGVGPPMRVQGLKMWASGRFVPRELQLLELRNRDLQHAFYRPKPCSSRFLRCARHSFQKALPEWIVLDHTALHLIGMPEQLGNQVQVRDGLQEVGNGAEPGIRADLFEKRLCQSRGIPFVISVGSIQDLLRSLPDVLVADEGLPTRAGLLPDRKCVSPQRRCIGCVGELNLDEDLRILASRQTTDLRDTSPILEGLLKTTAFGLRDVSEKAKDVEEVGLA